MSGVASPTEWGDARKEFEYLIRCPVPSGVEFVPIFLCRNVDGPFVCVFVYAFSFFFGEVASSVSHCLFILVFGLFSEKSNAYIAEIRCLCGSKLLHMCSKGVKSLYHWAIVCVFLKMCLIWRYLKKGMLSSRRAEDIAKYERSSPLWKNHWALIWGWERESGGLCARRPGWKSGFWVSGVMGPGDGVILTVLHANLKLSSVGPINGWAEYSFGIDLWVIQGSCEIGIWAKAFLIWIQSLLFECTCQSTVLMSWLAQ